MDLMWEKEVPFTAYRNRNEQYHPKDGSVSASLSIGVTNQMLHLSGKSGNVEAVMKLFYKIIALDVQINPKTYANIVGSSSSCVKLEKIQPTNQMYGDIISFIVRTSIGTVRNKSEDLITLRHII